MIFLDAHQLAHTVLSRSPFFLLVHGVQPQAFRRCALAIGRAMHAQNSAVHLTVRDASQLDGAGLSRLIMKVSGSNNSANTCLFLYGIDGFPATAAAILNGFRERLGKLRAFLVGLREDRKAAFFSEAPDLVHWVGPYSCRAEDLAFTVGNKEIRAAIKHLEQQYGMTSKAFADSGHRESTIADAWLWSELLEIQRTCSGEAKK